MDVRILPSELKGETDAVTSKSMAHRQLICSALSDKVCKVKIDNFSDDILATVNAIKSMGCEVKIDGKYAEVFPLKKSSGIKIIDCNESGSTLRFLLPVVASLGITAEFTGKGRLPQRPISDLLNVMSEHSVKIGEGFPIKIQGKLTGGNYKIKGNISSQFISGLLFALPLCDEDSVLTVTEPIESKNYIEMTVKVLEDFGIKIERNNNTFYIKGKQKYIGKNSFSEGDWSNASYFLAKGIFVKNIKKESVQGDKNILEILKKFGGKIEEKNNGFRWVYNDTFGTVIDASDVPDLVMTVAAVAAVSHGKTEIINAERLRLKESDRIKSTVKMLNDLGVNSEETENGIIINSSGKIKGGTVDSFGDHRIVMACAIMGAGSENGVVIKNAEAVRKSYPDFFEDFKKLGGVMNVI